jgi:hypothetical protein
MKNSVRIMALALLMSVVCGFAIGLVDGEFTKLMIYAFSVLMLSKSKLAAVCSNSFRISSAA